MVLGRRKKEIYSLKQRIAELEASNEELSRAIVNAGFQSDSFLSPKILGKLVELAGTGIWIKQPENDSIWLSSVAREILGLKGNTSIPTDSLKLTILPEDRPAYEKAMHELRPGINPVELELKIARSDGDAREFRTVSMLFTMLDANDQRGQAIPLMLGTIRDITRLEKTRRDLVRAKEKAEESERYKNILLANISHEIRTPMNSIIGFSELLNIGNLAYEKRLEYVRIIKNQGISLLRMIDDVVELTKMESGKVTIRKSPCNIDLLLNELLIVFNQYKVAQNKDHLDIRVNYPPERGIILYTDPGRLQQLISNLLSNSIKYTEKGNVEIGYRPISEQRIEFYVKDTGIGLSRDLQKRIFGRIPEEENFPGKSEDSGLGLAISKNLIKLLGGKIWVESELGQGSTFFFTVPFEEIPESYHQMAPEEEFVIPSYTWKDKVILIVEDDDVNFRFLEAVLQDTSATILHASNGIQAVELCRSISKIDLILMDIRMPEMDGLQATRIIREFNRKVPIIAQTAYILEKEDNTCFEAGCNDQITKPLEIRQFFEKADRFLKEE